jgi:hypothetical protein
VSSTISGHVLISCSSHHSWLHSLLCLHVTCATTIFLSSRGSFVVFNRCHTLCAQIAAVNMQRIGTIALKVFLHFALVYSPAINACCISSKDDLQKLEQREAELYCPARVAGRCSWEQPFDMKELARILTPARLYML